MSTLQARLDRMREASAKKFPEEARAVMARATRELRESGILQRIPTVGESFPEFELPDSEGRLRRSEDLHARGPLVLSVYRGIW